MEIRIITCAAILCLVAVSANADISTDMLSLVIQPDGSAEIVNGTSAAIQFDGYEITSADGNLDPVGWYSITDFCDDYFDKYYNSILFGTRIALFVLRNNKG